VGEETLAAPPGVTCNKDSFAANWAYRYTHTCNAKVVLARQLGTLRLMLAADVSHVTRWRQMSDASHVGGRCLTRHRLYAMCDMLAADV